MQLVRYILGNAPPAYGWVNGDQVGPVEGDIFQEYRRQEATIPLSMVRLAAPILPGKVIGIVSNYETVDDEDNRLIPEYPMLFNKPGTTIVGPKQEVFLPPQSEYVVHGAVLAVVIGKKARWIRAEDARDTIFGYTIANDVTAQDLVYMDGIPDRGKSFDTFLPLGPWIETELDSVDLLLTCRVDDELRQMASTRDMVFTVAQLVGFVSSVMTLNPGDVILTGSPPGRGQITAGSTVEASIEGLGSLVNPVEKEPAHD